MVGKVRCGPGCRPFRRGLDSTPRMVTEGFDIAAAGRRGNVKTIVAAVTAFALVAALMGPLAPAVRASSAAAYTILDLGTLGGSYSYATEINDTGWVVGHASITGDTEGHGFLYKSSSPLIDLDGGSYSIAEGINGGGTVAGLYTFDEPYTDHAFAYDGTLPLNDLGTLTGTLGSRSRAFGVNDDGLIVGTSEAPGGGYHGFLWTSGGMTDLGAPAGYVNGEATAINDAPSPSIALYEYPPVGGPHAFVYHVATASWQDLGVFPNGYMSFAQGINDASVVVGEASIPNDPYHSHAFRSVNGNPLEDLGVLADSTRSGAIGINELGQIVGSSYDPAPEHAFLWESGQMQDLNDLLPAGSGWELVAAWGINNAGQIVGQGIIGGEWHAFLLSPSTATTVGTDVVVQPTDTSGGDAPLTLTFSSITSAGTTTLTIGSTGPATPAGFTLGTPPTYYEISTTASFAGPVTVCIDYSGISVTGTPTLQHYENGAWNDVTTSVDAANTTICGSVSSLSPFAIFGQASENEPPTVSAGGPYSVPEGGAIIVSAAGSDPDGGSLDYGWDLDANGTFETPGQSVTFSAASLDGPSSQSIVVRATDEGGLSADATTTVDITNVAPSVGAIVAPASPILIGAPVSVSATFTDPGTPDTHQAVWSWGDGGSDDGTLSAGSVSGTHTYTTPGVRTIVLTVTDDDGGSGSAQAERTVVYNLCLLYDPNRAVPRGSTMSIKLQLCDANRSNLSSPGIVLNVQGVSPVSPATAGGTDSLSATVDGSFRYDPTLGGSGGYIYNVTTKGLSGGTYAVRFTAGSDGYVYAARFKVK
jgi:probable HAF family extracellular repeat protein